MKPISPEVAAALERWKRYHAGEGFTSVYDSSGDGPNNGPKQCADDEELLAAAFAAQHAASDVPEDNPNPAEPSPIGKCGKCDAPIYVPYGFCGRCEPTKA